MSFFDTRYKIRDTRYEKGVVLLFTLMVMITLTSVVGAYLGFVQYSTRSTGAQIVDSQAIYLAEAGLQKAVWNITDKDGPWGMFVGQQLEKTSFGEGTYSVTATRVPGPGANIYTIESTGTVGGLSRSLQQQYSRGQGLTDWHEI